MTRPSQGKWWLLSAATAAWRWTLVAMAVPGLLLLCGSPVNAQESPSPSIEDLERQVEDLRSIVQLLLAPIGILIGVLTIGGALGVVFSLRDQRRISQFHELAVSSEVSSQRRTEQSYSSFLEESQKTLTLVNDTLALAREATDRAAHTMEQKTEHNLAVIEAKARELLEPLLDAGEFEDILNSSEDRTKFETIANELGAIEGYLLLQDIDLHPYSRFVKGIALYLEDDISAALGTIRQSAQDASVRELQLFAIYWNANLNIALGGYGEAEHVFTSGKANLPELALEARELDRMIDETKFFRIATERAIDRPYDRLATIKDLLIDLEDDARLEYRDDPNRVSKTSHEIARSRGDLLTWIAFQPDQVSQQLHRSRVDRLNELGAICPTVGDDRAPLSLLAIDRTVSSRDHAPHSVDLTPLNDEDDDVIRAWALTLAKAIYELEREPDLELTFGIAECDYFLKKDHSYQDLCSRFRKLQSRAYQEESAGHREQRKRVELAEMVLVCSVRRLALYDRNHDVEEARIAKSESASFHRQVLEHLDRLREEKVTIFSVLQRRPLRMRDFREEIESIATQAGLLT